MPAKKKETKEEKPKKKRATKRKTTAASKKKVKKPEVVEQPKEEVVAEEPEQEEVAEPAVEPQGQSSVPKEYFEKQPEVSTETEEAEDVELETPEEVAQPEEQVEEGAPEPTIQDRIDTHIAEESPEDTGFQIEEDEDLPAFETPEAPKEKNVANPPISINTESSITRFLPVIFYTLLALAVGVLLYVLLGYFVFKSDLAYEFQGTRTPVMTEDLIDTEVETEELDQVEILSTPTGYLRVRSGPSTTYDEVLKVFPGDTYTHVSTDGEWLEIELEEGVTGWIFAEYAEVLSE